MKRIVIITLMVVAALLFTMKYAPAQTSDPIVGTWYFELNHKINYDAMIDTLAERGVHRDSVYQHAMYYTSLAAVVISRCESSKMFFSPFENQVMLETNRYNDPTIVDIFARTINDFSPTDSVFTDEYLGHIYLKEN